MREPSVTSIVAEEVAPWGEFWSAEVSLAAIQPPRPFLESPWADFGSGPTCSEPTRASSDRLRAATRHVCEGRQEEQRSNL